MNFNLCSGSTAALASALLVCHANMLNLQSALADHQATAVELQPTTQAGVLSHREACLSRVESCQVWLGNRIKEARTLLEQQHCSRDTLAGSRTYTLSAIGTATLAWAVCIPRLQKGTLSGRSCHRPVLQSSAIPSSHIVRQTGISLAHVLVGSTSTVSSVPSCLVLM